MLKWFNNKKKDNKGFSLVELIIVVAIMAILVGLLAPQYIKYVERSRKSSDASNLDEMVRAVQLSAADAESTLDAATYKITIKYNPADGADGTEVTLANGTTGDKSKVEAALTDAVPEWKSTKLKSNRWGTNGKSNIAATIVVNEEGATTVSYEPADFAEYINKTATN